MRSKQQLAVAQVNPGQFGLNTQDAPRLLPDGFLTKADNCVIDKRGRIAARKGISYVTTSGGTSSAIQNMFEAEWDDGTTTLFSVGNNKVYTGTTTLTDITNGQSITDDDWQIVQLQDVVFFFQAGHAPLQYDKSVGTLELVSAHANYTGTVVQGTCALSSFGRLWTAKGDTVYWSDLLIGASWGEGSAGSIDLSTVFPQDRDTVVGLAAHNDFLIIFLTRNILVYGGASFPATMAISDTIGNIGCLGRDTIINTGGDLVFLDRTGLRSLGRTIQEKSSPIGSLSRNVNNDLSAIAYAETVPVRAVYSRRERLYIVMLGDHQLAYVFDIQFPLQDGSWRTTVWTEFTPRCGVETIAGNLYFGDTNGIRQYADYQDDGAAYTMAIRAPHKQYTEQMVLLMPKNVSVVTEGGSVNTANVEWSFDYDTIYNSLSYTTPGATKHEWGTAEFGIAEFSGGADTFRKKLNLTGSGLNLSYGWSCPINGSALAVQEVDIHMITGRVN